MRLLLVEDNPPLADVICRALQQDGYVIDWADNASKADSWLLCQNYDVVLLDLGLPDADGADVLRRLRASGKRTPVLVLSAREARFPRSLPTFSWDWPGPSHGFSRPSVLRRPAASTGLMELRKCAADR